MELSTITNRNKYTYTTINCNKFIHSTIAKYSKMLYTFSMSVRKIKKSYISCTGYFSSYKNKQPIGMKLLERKERTYRPNSLQDSYALFDKELLLFYNMSEKCKNF